MSIGSPKLARRERAIELAQRRLHRIEIETHRVKAELARLAADYEDDVADTLSRRLRRRKHPKRQNHFENDADVDAARMRLSVRPSDLAAVIPMAASAPTGHAVHKTASLEKFGNERRKVTEMPRPTPTVVEQPKEGSFHSIGARVRRKKTYSKSAGPLVCSLAVHAVALVFCLSLTFVTLVQPRIPLFASPMKAEEDIPAPTSEVKIEPSKFEDAELQNTIASSDEFNIADNISRDFEPAQLGAGNKAMADIGQLDALPSDLGTLMSGAGKPSSGKPGGDLGTAIFFGARSKGNRFVFVIDNSSSMKGGRLDTARAELVKTVESLSTKQSFYVIFVSDQTYPMFYPLPERNLIPATPANKKRLVDWLPKAILASGKNRELIKAMDMAAALRPQVVFLLWDGDLRYSDAVRIDVMTHLTAPNQWNFTVHTLGMGITSADSEQNLTAIAQAHGGLYRPIDVPVAQNR